MATTDYSYQYPELSDAGKAKTKEILSQFQNDLEKLFNTTIVAFTQNIADEITDDDSWIDVRQKTKDALCAYGNNGYANVNWVRVREKILEENREAIINDTILDKEAEIKKLKDQLQYYMSKI